MDNFDFGDISLNEDLQVDEPRDIEIPAGMDHSAHGAHGSHGGHAMAFSNNIPGTYLFESFTIKRGSQLTIYCFLTMIIAIIVEWIKKYRFKCQPPHKTKEQKVKRHLLDSSLYFLQMTLSYFIMLVAMTFNYALFFSAMFGFALGHFINHFPTDDSSRCKQNGCCEGANLDTETEKIRKSLVKEADCC